MDSSQLTPELPPAVRVVAMGVSGAGKSTIGALVADALNYPFLDGSALHPIANVSKLAAGTPLDEEDRWAWLEIIGNELAGTTAKGMVIACSSRKRSHRDAIRAKAPDVIFLHLTGSLEVLSSRLEGRSGHSIPRELLAAQLEALEPLGEDERGVVVDISTGMISVLDQSVAGIKTLSGQ